MNGSRTLAMAAGLLTALPAPAGGAMVWVGLCDGAHPGTQIPIPLGRDDGPAPAKACHVGCTILPERRSAGRRLPA